MIKQSIDQSIGHRRAGYNPVRMKIRSDQVRTAVVHAVANRGEGGPPPPPYSPTSSPSIPSSPLFPSTPLPPEKTGDQNADSEIVRHLSSEENEAERNLRLETTWYLGLLGRKCHLAVFVVPETWPQDYTEQYDFKGWNWISCSTRLLPDAVLPSQCP